MDSKKLLPILQRFKNQHEDEVFEKFFLVTNNLIDEANTKEEKMLKDALSFESKEFADTFERFSLFIRNVKNFQGVEGPDSPEKQFYITALCLESELRILASRQAFECGVAYGKILAT